MDFAAAWVAFSVGDQVKVSTGAPPPGNRDSLAWRQWRAQNFTGELRDKVGGDYPRMTFAVVCAMTAPNADGNEILYTLDAAPHRIYEAVPE